MLNLVTIMGRLTCNPEVKEIESNGNKVKVARMCLAVERDRATDKEKVTDFIDCVAWRNTAEFVEKYFKKGSPIIVQGRLETRQYEDKNGNNRKATEINVRTVNFCAYKKGEEQIEDEKSEGKTIEDLLNDGDLPF